jgi:hypothetical protein
VIFDRTGRKNIPFLGSSLFKIYRDKKYFWLIKETPFTSLEDHFDVMTVKQLMFG